ncbi:MAG: PEP-CTERM sorting domain-containing protein [Planctomycetota bacterium]
MQSKTVAVIVAAMLVALATGKAGAAILTIDSDLSSLTAESTTLLTFFGNAPGTVNMPGDTTSLSGALQIDFTPASVQLLGGSRVTATDQGAFLPGVPSGNTPGDTPEAASFSFSYASEMLIGADLDTATRGYQFQVADTAPRTLSGGVLGAGSPVYLIVAGEAHLGFGMPPLSDLQTFVQTSVSSAAGTFSLVGSELTVSFPFEFTVATEPTNFVQTVTSYSGVIVATGIVPEPASAAMAIAAAGALLLRRRRR